MLWGTVWLCYALQNSDIWSFKVSSFSFDSGLQKQHIVSCKLVLQSLPYAVLSRYLLACTTGDTQLILLQQHERKGHEARCTVVVMAFVVYAQSMQTASLNHA